ncbi:hypothetical protein [Halocalculus aciditolerans]|uniref:Uncharacterized protein n=1 Tax=Halocalculus aciditolerans TaxID=1383812 RepID=A0A830FJM5_9EURY|nr:hypothetical protein [Halocalculus aciditolerans]GGL53362.1 hypothetical protein GCM10009039_09430 [Halocalculus aciditolerans]
MGLVDIHFHESDLDFACNIGPGASDAGGKPATEPPVSTGDDAEELSGGPGVAALAVAALAVAVVATGVAVAVKKKLGGSADDADDISVQ